VFFLLLLGDPVGLERTQTGQDGTADPDGLFPLGWSQDSAFDALGYQFGQLLLDPLFQTVEHGGASRHDDVLAELPPNVHVALEDGVLDLLVDARQLFAHQRWLEQHFAHLAALVRQRAHVSVRQLEFHGFGTGAVAFLDFFFEVQSDLAALFLHLSRNVELARLVELQTSLLGQDLDHIVDQVSASQVLSDDGVRHGLRLENGHCVGHPVSCVKHAPSGATSRLQRQHRLNTDLELAAAKCLEHLLAHLFSVDPRVVRRLSLHDGFIGGVVPQLVKEGIMPQFLHIVPILDDTILYWLF